MLYCVLRNKEIIGRFKNKNHAIEYFTDRVFAGDTNLRIKRMTKEEYLSYSKKLIEEIKEKED